MDPFSDRLSLCKRCGCEIASGETRCPRCGFSPRQMGIRVALSFLLVVVIAMTAVMIPLFGGLAPLLLGVAAVSFVLAFVIFLVSMIATPSRLGSLFARF